MAALSLLESPLDPARAQPLDVGDPAFQALADRVFKGALTEAAAGAADFLKAGVYDIRIVCYYLLGALAADGPAGIAPLFGHLADRLTDSWDALGPAERKERRVRQSVAWLLEMIHTGLSQGMDDDAQREAWIDAGDIPALEAAEGEARRLGARLAELWAAPNDDLLLPLNGARRAVDELRQDLVSLLPREDAAAAARAPEHARPTPIAAAPEPAPIPEAAAAPPAAPGHASLPRVEGSEALARLLAKLKAFDALARRGDFDRAAVVADDINEIVANFDPRVYLPALFSGYYSVLGEHIDEIASFWAERDSMRWEVLRNLYVVDLGAFAKE